MRVEVSVLTACIREAFGEIPFGIFSPDWIVQYPILKEPARKVRTSLHVVALFLIDTTYQKKSDLVEAMLCNHFVSLIH